VITGSEVLTKANRDVLSSPRMKRVYGLPDNIAERTDRAERAATDMLHNR